MHLYPLPTSPGPQAPRHPSGIHWAHPIALCANGRARVRLRDTTYDLPCAANLGVVDIQAAIDGAMLAVCLLDADGQPQAVLAFVDPSAKTSEDAGEGCVIDVPDKLTLKCGKASITLHANGKLVLHGVQVVSQADEQNVLFGATVKIN